MISHLPVLPIVVPLLVAALMLLWRDLRAQRVLALASALTLVVLAAQLLVRSAAGEPQAYLLGAWPAPFGIALVLDRTAALLVAVTSLVGLAALLASYNGWDRKGDYFHPLFQMQLAGLNAAFLTGDLFNLFVAFEVLLLASFCLLLHGLGRERLRAGLHYVMFNLAASAAFLVGVSLIYGVVGTLNMADIAVRVAALPPADQALVRSAALILLVVFGAKAALFPLSLWLPGTYAAVSPPVAALFAVMTKVGAYAIIRVHVMLFGPQAGELAGLAAPWLLGAALATIAAGVLGALAADRLTKLAGYLTLVSVGTMLLGIALFERQALAGALYYVAHSSFALAALFLLAPLIGEQRGDAQDRFIPGPALAQPAVLGLLLLVVGAMLAGLPPLSGFFGKLLILQGARDGAAAVWVWLALLSSALFVLLCLAKAGSMLVWAGSGGVTVAAGASWRSYGPPLLMVACAIALAVAAGPAIHFVEGAAAQLLDPAGYIRAVLGR